MMINDDNVMIFKQQVWLISRYSPGFHCNKTGNTHETHTRYARHRLNGKNICRKFWQWRLFQMITWKTNE